MKSVKESSNEPENGKTDVRMSVEKVCVFGSSQRFEMIEWKENERPERRMLGSMKYNSAFV